MCVHPNRKLRAEAAGFRIPQRDHTGRRLSGAGVCLAFTWSRYLESCVCCWSGGIVAKLGSGAHVNRHAYQRIRHSYTYYCWGRTFINAKLNRRALVACIHVSACVRVCVCERVRSYVCVCVCVAFVSLVRHNRHGICGVRERSALAVIHETRRQFDCKYVLFART